MDKLSSLFEELSNAEADVVSARFNLAKAPSSVPLQEELTRLEHEERFRRKRYEEFRDANKLESRKPCAGRTE